MAQSTHTKIRFAELDRVFGGPAELFHAHLARLSVLYEDLHLELTEASEKGIAEGRRSYFVRRSIGTLRDFGECLVRLDGNDDFRRAIRRQFTADERVQWDAAIDWFRTHKAQIQHVRNDLGGHFSEDAALFVVRNARHLGIGKLEVKRDLGTGKVTVRLRYAAEIASYALARRREASDLETYIRGLIATAFEGYSHAVQCVHLLLEHYIAPRFGFPQRRRE